MALVAKKRARQIQLPGSLHLRPLLWGRPLHLTLLLSAVKAGEHAAGRKGRDGEDWKESFLVLFCFVFRINTFENKPRS